VKAFFRIGAYSKQFKKSPKKTNSAAFALFVRCAKVKSVYKAVHQNPTAFQRTCAFCFYYDFSRKGRCVIFYKVFPERHVVFFYVKVHDLEKSRFRVF